MGAFQSDSTGSSQTEELGTSSSGDGRDSKGLLDKDSLVERKGHIPVLSRYTTSRKIEDDYTIKSQVLGTGASGPVKLATDSDGVMYAVKSFKILSLSERKRTELKREVSMCLVLDHPHIVRMERVYETAEDVHIVMEHMSGGELYSRLMKHQKYHEEIAARTTRQMLLAVSYLHAHKVVHRDLKLENFLYEQKEENELRTGTPDHLKLIDFGFAKFWDGQRGLLTQSCGTPSYVAPEVLKKNYTEKADLWSLGVIVYMLLTGRALFVGETDREVLKRVKSFQPHWSRTFFEPLSQEAKNFVKSLIVQDPADRMSAQQALDHPWLNITHSKDAGQELNCDVLQSLRRFGHASRFRRACLSMMAWSLSREDRQELRQQFLSMDCTGKGTITLQEFKEVVESGYHIESLEAQQIFEGADVDGDQEISYSEFLAAAMHDHVRMHNDVLLKTFRRFDKSGTGSITVEDLREVLGDNFEGTSVEDLIGEADYDNDGKIKYEDFLEYLLKPDEEEEEELDQNENATQPDRGATSATVSLAEAMSQMKAGWEGQTDADLPPRPSTPEASPINRSGHTPMNKRREKLLQFADNAISKLHVEPKDETLSPIVRHPMRRRTSPGKRLGLLQPESQEDVDKRAATCPAPRTSNSS